MSRLCSWAVALKLCFVQNNIVHFSLPYNVESNEPARNIDTLGDAVMVVVGLRTVQTELLALFEVFEFIREKKNVFVFAEWRSCLVHVIMVYFPDSFSQHKERLV